jgi:hypothetical protein
MPWLNKTATASTIVAISRVRKADNRARHREEASGRYCPVAVFDEPTLGQVLDEYDAAPPSKRKALEPGIYQQIIRFRSRLTKGLDEDERHDLERRIAAYSNSLVKRK